MTSGQTIAKTPVTLVNDFTGLVKSAHIVGAVSALGGSPDVYSNLVVNNQNIKSPLLNVKAPLAQIPAGDPTKDPSVKWLDTATGTTSVITVPKTASGDILVQGPTSFTIDSDLSPNANGSNSFPTVLACTAVSGEDLDIARIHVNPVGQQNLDVTDSYACDWWAGTGVPTNGTVPNQPGQFTSAELKTTLPTSVSPGETIASTNTSFSVTAPTAITFIALLSGGANWDGIDGTIPDAALSVGVNGQTSSSPLENMTAPLTPPVAAPYPVTAAGATAAITVPANASGDLTVSAPRQFTAQFALEPSATASADGATPTPFAMLCTADDTDDLTLATIPVVPPAAHASLTATSPRVSAYGTAVKVPVGVTAPVAAAPKPAPAGGTQSIDVSRSYSCNAWENQTSVPTDGTAPTFNSTSALMDVYTEFNVTLPAAVNPGSSIPATDFSLTWEVPGEVASDLASDAGVDQTSMPDTALGTEINGQTGTSALTNLGNAALSPLPSDTTHWQIEADGQTPPISVPANATSDLTIQAPQTYNALFTAEPSDPTTGTAVPWALQCTAADPLYLATVRVVRPLPKPATAPTPTGKVLIMRGSKGVAQGTLVKGKANVVIPGTALPVGKSTLTIKYTGDSNTLAAPSKTITVVKTKASPSLAVHVTPGKVAAGAVFPTVNVRLTGPGKAKGGKFIVTVGSVHKTATLLFDGTQSVQLPPFASAGHKVIRVAYAGNANFVAKTVTAGLNVTKTGLGKFVVKVKPGKIVAKKTRATLLIRLGAPDKLGHGLVTVRLAGHVLAKKLITGTGRITLPKFPSAGRKLLHLTFAGNASVVSRTITKPVKVTKPARHRRK